MGGLTRGRAMRAAGTTEKILLLLTAPVLLTACAGNTPADYNSYLAKRGVPAPQPATIPHCRGYNCRHVDSLSLSAAEWEDIARPFRRTRDAAAEREAIKSAIGLFEQKLGAQNGTTADRAGTYVAWGDDQHDCVDESVNTTVYLSLLRQKKLMRFHEVHTPASRLPLLGGGLGPHQAAVITETATGESFAVDSWFYDNGHPAVVIALDDWFYGWRPNR